MLKNMTIRRKPAHQTEIRDHDKLMAVGRIIKKHRTDLIDIEPSTRWGFIEAAWKSLPNDWISEKSLANIENGHNLPSLTTLYSLAIAFQIDPEDLFAEIARALSGRDAPTPDTGTEDSSTRDR